MKTVLEAIKQYPQEFISTFKVRANTTPSKTNQANHLAASMAVESESWGALKNLLEEPCYRKPLEGVIYCLETYSGIDTLIWGEIVDLYKVGAITEIESND
ncbi:hypothetical protein NVP1121O_100 [Vibrio phage 1.121.O._10N.286.46.C4]|nr:hypothetical protein NVP1121O_100 [Vibrio phage 1.121.O._10N.286.46.C4]